MDDEQQKIEARKNLRPGGRPLADGCFTVELDLSHFVRVHEERNQKTLMIIVADRSGSMKGRPWRQVRPVTFCFRACCVCVCVCCRACRVVGRFVGRVVSCRVVKCVLSLSG